MKLEAKTVDGEIQIRDIDTDNHDIVCVVPLTGDVVTDIQRDNLAKLICATPNIIASMEGIANDCEKFLDDETSEGPNELIGNIRDETYEYSQFFEVTDDSLNDDVCDQCMRSGVQVARTNTKGETICVDCDEDYDDAHPGEFDSLSEH